MAIMAKWGSKTWEVSSQKIAALETVSASVELDTENSDDKAGSPATKTKALKLQTMNFDFNLASAAGCDVRNEYESWTSLIGQYAPFFLADRRFGPANLQLTGVSLNDAILDDFGRILKGKISITLTEYSQEASSKKAAGASQSTGTSATTAKTTARKSSAVNVRASKEDKSIKKIAIKAVSNVMNALPGGTKVLEKLPLQENKSAKQIASQTVTKVLNLIAPLTGKKAKS